MESRLDLYRMAGERSLPKDLVEHVRRKGGRPKLPVVVHVRTRRDVEDLRRRNVPVGLLTSEKVSDLGYPMTFEPRLVLPQTLAGQVVSDLRVLAVRNPDTALTENVETLATLMLRVDKVAARALVDRNKASVKGSELYRVVVNEGLERAATKVRMQDYAGDLPVVGAPMPRADLDWVLQNNPARDSK